MWSKLTCTSSRSLIVATTGCVDGSWSWRYAPLFSIIAKVVQASVHSVTSAVAMCRCPLGEGLVEPEVVPPLHGHEVAEPHVRELVQDRDDAALADRIGRPSSGKRSVSVKVTAPAFSIAPALNSGTNSWSYLSNGYGEVELVLVELEALAGDVEDVLGVDVLRERLARVDRRAGSCGRRGDTSEL